MLTIEIQAVLALKKLEVWVESLIQKLETTEAETVVAYTVNFLICERRAIM